MSTRDTAWPEGTPCWADLMAPDREAAWAFYTTVMGWQINDSGPEMGHYGMASVQGREVAGIGSPPDPAQAPPPAWTTYLAVDDLDKTLALVTANGGQIAVPAMDVGGAGRMAIAIDPNGAAFGMWQTQDFNGARLVNEPGGMVWNQNISRDAARAQEFYAAVFGYTFTPMQGPSEYATIDGAGPGNTVGGLGAAGEDRPADAPAMWEVYFQVADADEAAVRINEGGGQMIEGPLDTPFGRMGTARDPQGAAFSIMAAPSEGSAATG